MTIEDTKVIDVLGVDRLTGRTILTISDHLDWTDEERHLLLLQDKINAYLRFVESGEIFNAYSAAIGKELTIRIVAEHDLSARGRAFVETAARVVRDAELTLEWTRLGN